MNQVYPEYASRTTESFVPDTALLGGQVVTQTFNLPANAIFSQYEAVVCSGLNIAKIAGAPTAGDVIGIVCYEADNRTATAASLRTTQVQVVTGGFDVEYNQAKLVFPASSADVWRHIAASQGIKFSTPLSFKP
jgi:hypothetical protein